MSQGRPRAAQSKKSKKAPSTAERLAGGELWDKPTKPDDTARLLRARPGSHDPTKADAAGTEEGPYEGDYTDSVFLAMKGEGEPVDEESSNRFAQEGRRAFAAAHEDEIRERQAKIIANKVVSIQREGSKLGIDFAPRLAGWMREANAEIAAKRRESA